ncbi:hypothetical protein E2C01_011093 [Portunus trituberculatus]|uniref:Uncharacterized protein n=1 Tax=Portunus trituberculatus TaxID=210409 RepID=A0A5B7DAM3_PORTR|nr:hypothetical protein [Portunus trituberculatus]
MHVWKHYRQISPGAPRWARRYKKAGSVARQVTPWTIVEAEGSLGTRGIRSVAELLKGKCICEERPDWERMTKKMERREKKNEKGEEIDK